MGVNSVESDIGLSDVPNREFLNLIGQVLCPQPPSWRDITFRDICWPIVFKIGWWPRSGLEKFDGPIGPWTCYMYPGIQNSNMNISFDLRLWFHTISHDYLPVLSVLVQLRTPDIRSPDRLLFYLTAIMPPRTYIAFALIFIYSELRNSELHHIT